MDKLRDAVRRINRDDDGNPYLDDVTIDRAIRARGQPAIQGTVVRGGGVLTGPFPDKQAVRHT